MKHDLSVRDVNSTFNKLIIQLTFMKAHQGGIVTSSEALKLQR